MAKRVTSCGYVEVTHETHYYIKSALKTIFTGKNIQRLISVQNHSTLTGMVLSFLTTKSGAIIRPQLFELDLKHAF